MDILYLLIPLSVILIFFILGGLWWAIGIMATVGVAFAVYLWRKRLLARASR